MILHNDIRRAIREMHESKSLNWSQIEEMSRRRVHFLEYNIPQLIFIENQKNFRTIFNKWGRATGKTTAMGGSIKNIVTSMPRSLNLIVSQSYKKFFTEIIPSLRKGLELHGLYEDLHYFVGKKPPKNWKWDLPYQYPSKDQYAIYFWTGACYVLASQDVPGSALGLNTDSILYDEAKLLDPIKIEQEAAPTKRGSNVHSLRNKPYFLSEIFFSSAPILIKERWMNDYCENLQQSRVGAVIEAPTKMNEKNLPENFLRDAEAKSLSRDLFLAEYWNITPKMVQEPFYTFFSETKHGYIKNSYSNFAGFKEYEDTSDFDGDVVRDAPIILGLDYGANINFAVACQLVNNNTEFRALKEFFVLHKNNETQTDLANKFAKYYKNHLRKEVRLIGDSQGAYALGTDTRTRVEIFREDLAKQGWSVIVESIGATNPKHHLRRTLWELIFLEKDAWLPRFRINLENCANTVIAIENTRTRVNGIGEISKDKSSEKASSGVKPEHAVHATDALDYPVWLLFSDLTNSRGIILPEITSFSHTY